jgi:hypothetical protein
MRNLLCLAPVLAVLLPNPALAYIGPGAGLGATAVVVALVIGLLLLLVGLVWYPLKRMLKLKRGGGTSNGGPDGS